LRAIGAEILDGMKNLTTINFSSNELGQIGAHDFAGLTQVINLDLSSNYIATIDSEAFKDLVMLQILNLNFNSLTSFNVNLIIHSTQLEELYLRSNDLTHISNEPSLEAFSLFSLVDLIGNYCIDELYPATEATLQQLKDKITETCAIVEEAKLIE